MEAPEGQRILQAPVVLRDGDRPRLFVKCSRDCTVRVLHVFADGMKTVIVSDYPVAMEQANQWVVLPVKMRMTPPFGVEQLLVQAVSGGALPPLKVREERTGANSVRRIVEGDLHAVLTGARGSVLEQETIFAEARYSWTILPNGK